jgi:molybdate-binding protein/DNA-binding XRE family transcriptional regulator
MANQPGLKNVVREERVRRGWSQQDLAHKSGLSRTGISAIETDRLVPSAAAALALARAMECRVEDLFSIPGAEPEWAWAPSRSPCRYWKAEVSGRVRLYPAEASTLGLVPHDGVSPDGRVPGEAGQADRSTLVIACCDPAVGLLSAELARGSGIRLIVVPRSSRSALDLLGKGLVHAAGVHLARNESTVGEVLGAGYSLIRAAGWEEGVTFSSSTRIKSALEAARQRLRWVGREPGSGARQCLDELLGDRPTPRRMASDHRAVAEAVRAGWADAGVCHRLASEEAGLSFLHVRREAHDLCFADSTRDDPRLKALLDVLRSTSYRRKLGELPGFDSAETGEIQHVAGS